MEYKIERRKFFNTSMKGLAAFILIKAVPFKSIFIKRKINQEVKVKIHPYAVKRNRKGLNG